MTNQERQDYQFYDQNKIKEEIQNQNQVQKQGKKGGYSKNFKEGTQRGNQNIIEDKNTNQNINEYNNNYQNFRKHKKGYTNYQGKNQNEEFDNRQRTNSPQGFKKNKRKRKDQKEEFIFENQQNNHQQIYNKAHKKNQINTQQQRQNQINNNNNYNNNNNMNTNNNVNNNNNFFQNINNNNNEQFKQNMNLNPNNLNNQNFNYQNQQNPNKQNLNKGNMIINTIPNQNLLYNMNPMKQNDSEKKDEKSSEGTTEDLSQSSFSNMNRMMENQDNINRHMNMGNSNMNQFLPNDILMNKNYLEQQSYQRLPANVYNNMRISIEQNQLFNNMNNQNSNFPFGVNEEAMKYKKMNKKIQKSPNEGNMVNMNPNINMGNMVNIPNLNFPSQITNNTKFFKNNNGNNLSLNNKGSLSMQSNKNTMPNFNSNLNLNFMIPQKSPQAPQNTIPQNMINQNLNLNMSQRNFYNNNQNNMNKRHQQLIYKRVNSDKNLLGIDNKSKELYNHNIQNKNCQKFHNNNMNNNNLQNPNSQQQKIFQIKEEWVNNLKNMQNQQQMYNMNNNNLHQLKKNFASSLHVVIKIDRKRYEVLELRPGEEPKNLINTLKKSNNNLSEPLISLIYQKINNALNFNKSILDLVPSKYTLKQMNMIKNCLIDKETSFEMQNRMEPFLERNTSFINNQNQFENFISEIKPSYEDIKVTDILNITQ